MKNNRIKNEEKYPTTVSIDKFRVSANNSKLSFVKYFFKK
jgi:hypothetical protein